MVQIINTSPDGIFSYLGFKSHQQTMEPIEIKILQYTFRFRQLSWREESSIKVDGNVRILLAHALVSVSGLLVNSVDEAMKVLKPLPLAVIQRIMILWRGAMPTPRMFSTIGLYKAPNTEAVAKRVKEIEDKREKMMDKVEAEMRQKFGNKEIDEALEMERQMLKNSKMRGATKASPDENRFGATPPTSPEKKNAN